MTISSDGAIRPDSASKQGQRSERSAEAAASAGETQGTPSVIDAAPAAASGQALRVLGDYAPTRYRRRLTWFSREPVTGQIGEVWHRAAERARAQTVTVDRAADIDPAGATARSYEGWAQLVDQAAAWLYAAGARPGDRVAIMKRNHFDVALLACAAARIGALPASLAGGFEPFVAHTLLARLERPFLVVDARHLQSCDLNEEVVARLTARTICLAPAPDRPDLLSLAALHGAPAAPVSLRRPHEPMIITHTSGTTGIPKLVAHAADSARSLALVEAERWPFLGLRSDDVWAFCDPYYHQRVTTGMLAMATATPSLVLLSAPDTAGARALLSKHQPTVVETLPNIYLHWEPLAREPDGPFRRVRLFINSFDAIHTRTIRTFLHASQRKLPVWVQSWSQSEAGPIVLRPYLRSSVRVRGRRPPPTQVLGWPLFGLCKLRAVDIETGEPVPAGQPGLIEISQPGRCLAYVGEQARHSAKCSGEWWNTGDIGTISRLGAVRLLDREIDRIPGASGLEIEDVLLDRLPNTTEVVVLAVEGGLPVPLYSTCDDLPIDPATWAEATADLPRMAEPLRLRWEEFPRTITWKIRRLALRQQLLLGARAVGLGHWT